MKSMKKIVCLVMAFALMSALLLSSAQAATLTAALKARTLRLHPNEAGSVLLTVKNKVEGTALAFRFLSANEKVISSQNVTAAPTEKKDIYEIKVKALDKTGSAKLTLALDFTDAAGKVTTKKLTLIVSVATDFAPQIRWSKILLAEETGYPQLKLSMTDDFSLRNVCFVRTFTEGGKEQSEIFDIVTLGEQKEAVCFRTLDKPGAYSVQVNDNAKKTNRLNSETLITLVDTDDNGVVDAYYVDDATALVNLNIAGGLTSKELEAQQ